MDDELRERLRGAGLRVTRGRLRVLEYLSGGAGPRSHGEVVDALAAEGLDRTSVFRNLRDLVAVGHVRRFDAGDRVWRYEVVGTSESSHLHIICRDCGVVSCASGVSVAIEGVDPALAARGLEVQLQGLCDGCA